MSLIPASLPPIARSIASLINIARCLPPEVASIPCVDPVETAADKLSALAWRVHARRRGSHKDDPTMIRYLHDLAALKMSVIGANHFRALVRKAAADDVGRGGRRLLLPILKRSLPACWSASGRIGYGPSSMKTSWMPSLSPGLMSRLASIRRSPSSATWWHCLVRPIEDDNRPDTAFYGLLIDPLCDVTTSLIPKWRNAGQTLLRAVRLYLGRPPYPNRASEPGSVACEPPRR